MEKLTLNQYGQWLLEKSGSVAVGSYSVPDPKKKKKDIGEQTQYAGPSPSQSELNKSNYGPKGAGAYTPADNARRKQKNTNEEVVTGSNRNVKQYAPTGLSAKQQASKETQKYNRINRKQPIKTFTPEEIAAYKAKIAKSEILTFTPNGQWNLM